MQGTRPLNNFNSIVSERTSFGGRTGAMEAKMESGNSSDREGDTFEDAHDTTTRLYHSASSNSTRSLTGRRPSSPLATPTILATEIPPVPLSEDNGDIDAPESNGHVVEPSHPTGDGAQDHERPPKSPLLTSHRISATSLDDINLKLPQDDDSSRSRSSTLKSKPDEVEAPAPPPRLPSRSQGLSGALPSVPWGPPPVPPRQSVPLPAALPRKLTSPFSWLSRNTSAPKEVSAPPLPAAGTLSQRRNTSSSVATIGSNPELMLSRLEEGHDTDGSVNGSKKPIRNSLRERFKMLRMREEAGITSLDNDDASSSAGGGGALAGLIGRSASVGLGIASPTSIANEQEGGLAGASAQSPSSVIPPPSPLDPKLAPGTVAGVSAGPSAIQDPAAPVDWDLWQSVVYEGPTAVARTSPEELNQAITSGIPSAIRGVVWQVLAQSKNEELETVYKELVVRGTEKAKDRSGSVSGQSMANGSIHSSSKEKESVASSASSVHSDHSTPVVTGANGLNSPSPSHEKDAESMLKAHANSVAERKKKAQEDAAGLQKLEKAIKRDLGARTSYSKYAAAAGLQDGLFGVCKAYALFDEAVGYAQGMNFLAMPLLFNMPEEEAFCLLVRLMNQYHIRDMFIQDMPGLHLHLYQFERLLEDLEPALYCHLHRRGVTPQLYATQWFLTLFAYRFPLQLVLRVYDLLLSEGLEGAILKFGIVLMQKNAQTLLGMNDMSTLTNFLKERIFDVYIDQAPSANSILESGFFGSSGGIEKEIYRADALVQDACAVKVTPEILKTYTAEWNEKARFEKEREAEIDALRNANSNLSLKVRSLEERAERSDREHVEMASELVRTKVRNEELQDFNESLIGQVDELRVVVERQPEDIEKRLKDEMDRIMKRNIEVQNENRALEEQMADMEKDLVETKMQYAEINSNHETLKQKWNDLRKALDG